jgi:hypothetical protein
MTVTDRDETDEPAEPIEARDALGVAIGQVIAAVFEALPADCAERKAALTVAIEAHTRIATLLRQPRLN